MYSAEVCKHVESRHARQMHTQIPAPVSLAIQTVTRYIECCKHLSGLVYSAQPYVNAHESMGHVRLTHHLPRIYMPCWARQQAHKHVNEHMTFGKKRSTVRISLLLPTWMTPCTPLHVQAGSEQCRRSGGNENRLTCLNNRNCFICL